MSIAISSEMLDFSHNKDRNTDEEKIAGCQRLAWLHRGGEGEGEGRSIAPEGTLQRKQVRNWSSLDNEL